MAGYIGGYSMPNPVEIRKLYAETEAEKVNAAALEASPRARAVVDDVNFVRYEMRRVDLYENKDSDPNQGVVRVDQAPGKVGFFGKLTGAGMTPVEEIALHASPEQKATRVQGVLGPDGLDVAVTLEGRADPLVYSKTVAEDGTVMFQRGHEIVGMDKNGNLFQGEL